MKKYLSIFIIILIFLFLTVFIFGIKNSRFQTWAVNNMPDKAKAIINIVIKDKSHINKFHNDYNTKFLPNTQFKPLKFRTKKLKFLTSDTVTYYEGIKKENLGYLPFFIEILKDDNILITDVKGNINLIKNFARKEQINNENVIKINTDIEPDKVLDTYVNKDKLFISYIISNDKCKTFNISFANFNFKFLKFEKFFDGKQCGQGIQGGRMQAYKHKNFDGLIFSIANNISDKPNDDPQNKNSFFGKIVFKSFDNSYISIFSKGHRNPQGLIVTDKTILSTEHGPSGGDEINNIKFNKNYGWPVSSYGKKYGNKENKLNYKLNHSDFGFEEPIFAFIPSIGISEIIKIPNNFVKSWNENFIITSLNRGSMYRVKFDKNYERLIYKEEIFIGQRIRDIKYDKKNKIILLALESKSELGIIRNKNE